MNNNEKILIKIDDGVVGYFGNVDTGWSAAEVMAAFIDGYDTGSMERGEKVKCHLYESTLDLHIDFSFRADGQGGVLDAIMDYPYAVTWRQYWSTERGMTIRTRK